MFTLTRHASQRRQQRGISNKRLSALFEHADIDRPAGRNCYVLRVSREYAATIRGGDKLSGLAAVVSDDTNEIVTLKHIAGGRRWHR